MSCVFTQPVEQEEQWKDEQEQIRYLLIHIIKHSFQKTSRRQSKRSPLYPSNLVMTSLIGSSHLSSVSPFRNQLSSLYSVLLLSWASGCGYFDRNHMSSRVDHIPYSISSIPSSYGISYEQISVLICCLIEQLISFSIHSFPLFAHSYE